MTDQPVPPATANLAAALVAARAGFPPITKSRSATVTSPKGSYSYRFADLSMIVAATSPILAAHGLVAVQDVTTTTETIETPDGPTRASSVAVTTVLLHVSGEQLVFGPIALPAGATPQAMGSAVTYARRYGLCGALGIAAEDDDDGEHAATHDTAAPRTANGSPSARSAPVTREQLHALGEAAGRLGWEKERIAGFVANLLGRSVRASEMTAREASQVIDALDGEATLPTPPPEPDDEPAVEDEPSAIRQMEARSETIAAQAGDLR